MRPLAAAFLTRSQTRRAVSFLADGRSAVLREHVPHDT